MAAVANRSEDVKWRLKHFGQFLTSAVTAVPCKGIGGIRDVSVRVPLVPPAVPAWIDWRVAIDGRITFLPLSAVFSIPYRAVCLLRQKLLLPAVGEKVAGAEAHHDGGRFIRFF